MSIWLGNQRLDSGAVVESVNGKTGDVVLSGKDIKDTVTYDNITNCITEIPQDIELETVSDGTTRIKAGSKVYIPNGPGVFDTVTIPRNITIAFMGSVSAYLQYAVFVKQDGSNTYTEVWSSCYSGATQPSVLGRSYWYDTANNVMKYSSGGTTWTNANCSLPVAIVTVLNGKIKSIDQIFNGFGYIGSTVFALPGVKGLIPDGRNADGSLKNKTSYEITTVKTITPNDGDRYICLLSRSSYIDVPQKGDVSYDETKNITFRPSDGTIRDFAICGAFRKTSSGITDFYIKTAFHALDYSDTGHIGHQAMPSDKYIELTLGASGASYTASADGWVKIFINFNSTNNDIQIRQNGADGVGNRLRSGVTGWLGGYIPVQKGQLFDLSYAGTYSNYIFRFFYTQGSK